MYLYIRFIFIIVLFSFISCSLSAQALNTGSIKGLISDESGSPLNGANIRIENTAASAVSGSDGSYLLKNISPGSYNLTISFVGYEPVRKQVNVGPGKTVYADARLKTSSFQIGGIDVIGQAGMLPQDASSTTKISSGEIEHYQATSVSDVLDLVPGITKTQNPGIATTAQAAVRGDHYDETSALGTLIIVDGTPLSNNANLQFGKLANNLTGISNTGGGIDLRTIPADNIQSIDVISGLPSVRYGDVTEGVIRINTKLGAQPHRLKIKQNPDTKEANLGGGFEYDGSAFGYNVNYARSEREIRTEGDEFSRLTAQMSHSFSMLEGQLSVNQKLTGQQLFDYEEPRYSMFETRNYNKSWSAGYSNWGKYSFDDETSRIEYNFHVNLNNQNTMRSKVNAVSGTLLNGDTVAAYRGIQTTVGKEWTAGGRLEYNKKMISYGVINDLLFGTEIQYNANTGDGVILDSVYNYYAPDSPRRSYKFDDIPGQALVSLYAGNTMSFRLGIDFKAMIGFRYEMYRPYQLNLKGLWGSGDLVRSHQGSFFNPRFSLIAYLSSVSQIRFNAGTVSKSPAMSSVYGSPIVYNVKRTMNDSSVIRRTVTFETWNSGLKGFRELQLELSYDHRIRNFLSGTVNIYMKERDNEAEGQEVPYFLYYKDAEGRNYIEWITSDSYPMNLGWTNTKGAEIILKSARIEPLNMTFQINTSYLWSDKSRRGFKYNDEIKKDYGQVPNYKVPGVPVDTLIGYMYAPEGKWYDRLQMNYYVTYTNPQIGLWLTLRAENVISYRNQNYSLEPREIERLSENQKTAFDYATAVVKYTPKWLFNLSVSKSLFKGAELSFYVNNFLDDPGMFRLYNSPTTFTDQERNPSMFYGLEFSCMFDNLFGGGK